MSNDKMDADFYRFRQLLTGDEEKLIRQVREFMEAEVAPTADEYWNRAEFPHPILRKWAALGLAEREMNGGPKLSALARGLVTVEQARVDASTTVGIEVHEGLALNAIKALASEEQQQRWIPALVRADKIGAYGLTEPQGGSDVAEGMRTTARREGDTWILNGAKRWIGNGTFADLVVIFARDEADHQIKAFVVEKGTPGFTATKIENKIALRAVQNADITLTDCRVSEANRLARAESWRDIAGLLGGSRAGVAWIAIGVMTAVYEYARDYAIERQQFGRSIAKFQLIQELLVQILGNLTASMSMAVRMAQLEDAGQARPDQAAMAKAFATARMRESVSWAREILGGNGIVTDYHIARYFCDAEGIYTFEGTRQINTLVTGKAITGQSAFV